MQCHVMRGNKDGAGIGDTEVQSLDMVTVVGVVYPYRPRDDGIVVRVGEVSQPRTVRTSALGYSTCTVRL
jgi:hypothetical protein